MAFQVSDAWMTDDRRALGDGGVRGGGAAHMGRGVLAARVSAFLFVWLKMFNLWVVGPLGFLLLLGIWACNFWVYIYCKWTVFVFIFGFVLLLCPRMRHFKVTSKQLYRAFT
ncbi:hypothetical protein ES332_D10G259800v1 [Gossypium tomentosum]|uniref:Uncharacterized protein n=1 Tax=Gossypium tomentosum TaxID=34277 RepID=A0A5D2J8J8_GOSTO|nr:hypothetical protein ES332_D10G259800v1 [Gossypium tomentosum]